MEKETRIAIGRNISKLRKKKGLSQKALAEQIGIGFPNISYIENGKYAPRLNTLIKLSKVLDAEMYEFFILDRHLDKENVKQKLFKALDEDETLLRLVYRLYLAIKADFSPLREKNEQLAKSEKSEKTSKTTSRKNSKKTEE